MTTFIMVYKGAATDMSDMSPEQQKAVMDKWGQWMGQVGDALTDIGAPFGPGISVVDNGSTGAAAELTGYSLVKADDLAAAQKLTVGHPFLSEGEGEGEGKGNYSIEVYELMPVPM